MDNFVFASELELSIIEHRLELILGMLEKANTKTFFPAIIFNESFWQLGYEKKLSIIAEKQADWIGGDPKSRTLLYADQFYIDIIKSIKVTYFNYTKLSLDSFLEIIKTKNKFTISDFTNFGDSNHSPIQIVNDIIVQKQDGNVLSKEAELLSKIQALKYYTNFLSYDKINSLIFIYEFNEEYWEAFFEAIKKLDESQNTKILKNSVFTFLFINSSVFEKFNQNLEKYKYFENIEFISEFIDINSLELKQKYDFIFAEKLLSILPSDIITKYDYDFFNAIGRLTYTNKYDSKKAMEDIAIFNAPTKKIDLITPEIFRNIDFEISWKPYDNTEALNIIDQARLVQERVYIRFSIEILKLLVKLIKSLNPKGKVFIWDYAENDISKFSFGIFSDDNSYARMLVDFDLYQKILGLFEDINVNISHLPSTKIISEEILDGKDQFIRLGDLLTFINTENNYLQEFFDVKNFTFHENLKKVTKKYRFFTGLREKKFMLFGIPTLLYSSGFNIFKKSLQKDKLLEEKLDGLDLRPYNLSNYEKEYFRNILPKLVAILEKNNQVLITEDRKNKNNNDIKKVLNEASINENFFFEFITKYWNDLLDIANQRNNFELLEIRN